MEVVVVGARSGCSGAVHVPWVPSQRKVATRLKFCRRCSHSNGAQSLSLIQGSLSLPADKDRPLPGSHLFLSIRKGAPSSDGGCNGRHGPCPA